MTKKNEETCWVFKKLKDLEFKKSFEKEHEKLSASEQMAKLRVESKLK